MKTACLRLICRTTATSAMVGLVLSHSEAHGVTVTEQNTQIYWKDERCAEVGFTLASDISPEAWHSFFCGVFGQENNLIQADGQEILHSGSPILDDAQVFGALYIGHEDGD